MRKLIFSLVLLFLMTGVAYATVTTIEDFEALSTGSLGGQGGWTTLSGAAGDLTVENTVYYQGTQAAYHTDTATAAPWADKKSVTRVTSGIFGAYIRGFCIICGQL